MITCLPTILALNYGLDTGDGGLMSSGSLGQWAYGVATSGPGEPAVWGTRLDGTTFNDTDEFLEIPLPDLATKTRPVLIVEHFYELGIGDTGRFEVDTGAGFVTIEPIYGYPNAAGFIGQSAGWVRTGLDLSSLPAGSRVRLRFTADAAGTGPGWFVRAVELYDGDPVGPRAALSTSPIDTQDLAGPYAVQIQFEEDFQLESALLEWSTLLDGGTVPMTVVGTNLEGEIPSQPPGTTVSWTAMVADCEAEATVSGPPFRVFLAAPENFSGPDEPHSASTTVELTWSPPDSPHQPIDYRVEEVSSGFSVNTTITSASLHLDPDWEQQFVVRARFAEGFGDPSAPLTLDVEVPTLRAVEPDAAYPGETVYVLLEGTGLYLADGRSTVSFGDEIAVESFSVLDVDRGLARVAIEGHATPGPRAITVDDSTFNTAFEVLEGADAPRITSVRPDTVVQGSEIEVEVNASRVFAGPITITADDELLLGGDPIVSGDRATFRVAATGRARPGPHDLVLDDGERLWPVQIEVTEYRLPSRSGCSSVPGLAASLWWGLGLLVVRQKRQR